jgi:hypothetical protein
MDADLEGTLDLTQEEKDVVPYDEVSDSASAEASRGSNQGTLKGEVSLYH